MEIFVVLAVAVDAHMLMITTITFQKHTSGSRFQVQKSDEDDPHIYEDDEK